jgi:hypothetical protein
MPEIGYRVGGLFIFLGCTYCILYLCNFISKLLRYGSIQKFRNTLRTGGPFPDNGAVDQETPRNVKAVRIQTALWC